MYYLIGIKGSGMSALASILFDLGYEVEGSDVEKHFFTEEGLTKRGIKILPYNKENIKEGMTIIKGNSIREDNEELIKANELNLTIHTYQEMVAKLTRMFETITIAGCHGKTSTSALLSHVLGNLKGANSLEINKPIFYYGLDEDNDIIAKDVNYSVTGTSFDVFVEDNYYGHFDLPLYGKHQLLNALAVISVCYYERLEAKEVAKQIKTFSGAKRRFTETIVKDNVIIDDYAHHPTEVKVTIKAARQKYDSKELVVVFQPHTFTRTKEFAKDYIEILSTVDKAYIMDIHG